MAGRENPRNAGPRVNVEVGFVADQHCDGLDAAGVESARTDAFLDEETSGVGTRTAGRQIRTKCTNLLQADSTMKLVLDWTNVPLISSSFADEFIGRLFIALGPLQFMTRVRMVGMDSLIAQLIDQALRETPSEHRTPDV